MCQAVAEQGGTAVTESAEPRVLDAGSNELVPEGAFHPQRIGPRFGRCTVYMD